jgi:hypothetical protein
VNHWLLDFGIESPLNEEIVSRPITAQSFPINVEWDSKQALQLDQLYKWETYKEQARSSKNGHDLARAIVQSPVADEVAQAVKHEVLENHVHDENLITRGSVGVKGVNEKGARGS